MSRFWQDNMDQDRIEKIKKTLVVDRSHTHCGNCGRETLMEAKTHTVIAGYSGGGEGCGIKWEFITTAYMNGSGKEEELMNKLRPDLEYWNMYGTFPFEGTP